jgi:DNA-binding IclR family transcriptional regulator
MAAVDSVPPRARPAFPDVAGAQLLVRALTLLFHLREREEPVTVAELTAALRVAPSNVYRLLQTLELSGLVERTGRGQVALGLRFLDLARAVDRRVQDELVPAAHPVMRSLTQSTDETSLLTMPTGLHAICVLSVESSRPVRLSFATGLLFPLYAGASGKVLLPWIPARLRAQVLAEGGWTLASGEQLSAASLERHIEEIRADGCCVTIGEVDADATGVAAPIRAESGRLFGGLTLAGPTGRFADRLDELVERVRNAADEIARRLEERGNDGFLDRA